MFIMRMESEKATTMWKPEGCTVTEKASSSNCYTISGTIAYYYNP